MSGKEKPVWYFFLSSLLLLKLQLWYTVSSNLYGRWEIFKGLSVVQAKIWRYCYAKEK